MSSQLLVWSALLLVFTPGLALHNSNRFPPMPEGKVKNPVHIVPIHKELCLQGEESYMNDALKRLQDSNMKTGWLTTKVAQGTCAEAGYDKGPMPEHCFPQATSWSDGEPLHDHDKMDTDYVKDGNNYRTDGKHDSAPDIDCMYEVQGAKASKETHFIVPRTGWLCMEGPLDYISLALETLQASNMQTGWNSTEPVSGTCAEVGYTKLAPFEAGSQQLMQFCFPRAKTYIDPIQDTDQLKGMDMLFVYEFNALHPEFPYISQPVVECMDRVGSIF